MHAIQILILGAGFYAEEVADLVLDCDGYQLAGFIDEFISPGAEIQKMHVPVMTMGGARVFPKTTQLICGVGGRKRVGFIHRAAEFGFRFATLIHPSAVVSKSVAIGTGTSVRAGCVIAANVRIGNHVIVNRGCLIGHNVEIGDFVHLGPGANIAGKTVVGSQTEIGMGAIVIDNLKIGQGASVGAGSLVSRDVPDQVQVVGMPAQVIRKLEKLD